jgi:hypothetical protein
MSPLHRIFSTILVENVKEKVASLLYVKQSQ